MASAHPALAPACYNRVMAGTGSEAARLAVLRAQVAATGETGLIEVAERVARAVAEAEAVGDRDRWSERFAGWIRDAAFLPCVPTLANAGRGGQLAACFVLEISDTLDSIYGTLHRSARIQQGSGGVGIEFSALRPRGTPLARSGGHSPGPLAFAELFGRSAHVMGLSGRRAGAHLAILRDDHPDIVDFVRAKREAPERFPHLGFAVAVSDRLLRAAREGGVHRLVHPQTGAAGRIGGRELLREIAHSIHATGDPTLLFVDRIEAANPTPGLGRLRATNPCGEQPLLPDESCVLGSLHLPAFVDRERAGMDWKRLAAAVRDAVRFLDDVIDVNAHSDPEIERATLATRKIGLGVLGLADVLLLLELPYAEAAARELTRGIFAHLAREADGASEELAVLRGTFPAWKAPGPRRRNATTRAVAPTGTLRLLAGAAPGIEPWIAPVISLETAEGTLRWSDRWLEGWLAQRCADIEPVLAALAAGGSHAALPALSDTDRVLLRRAWEISPEAQLAMQAIAQAGVDGGVSKTVHVGSSRHVSPDQLVEWIQSARELGCKGVAFYCRPEEAEAPRIDLRAPCLRCP